MHLFTASPRSYVTRHCLFHESPSDSFSRSDRGAINDYAPLSPLDELQLRAVIRCFGAVFCHRAITIMQVKMLIQ